MSEHEPQLNQTPSSTPPESIPKEQSSNGALIGAIIVVLLLIVLGFYIFTNRENVVNDLNNDEAGLIENEIVNFPDEQKDNLQKQGDSDTINEIEKDVNDTNLENLDAEVQAIDQELDSL